MTRYLQGIAASDCEIIEALWTRYDAMVKSGHVDRPKVRERIMDAMVVLTRGKDGGDRPPFLLTTVYPGAAL